MPESISNPPTMSADNQPAEAAPAAPSKAPKRNLKKNVMPSEFGGPSKPRSAFFVFGDEKRADVTAQIRQEVEANPELKFAVSMVAKRIGELWKEVSEEEKKRFQEIADKEKVEFGVKEEEWKKSDGYKNYLKETASHKQKQAAKKAKDAVAGAGMPKRPMNSMMLFNGEHLAAVIADLKSKDPNGKAPDMKTRSAVLMAKWNAQSEEQKKVYTDKAAELKSKYDAEMEAFKLTDAYKTYQESLKKATSEKNMKSTLAKKGMTVGDKKRLQQEKEANKPAKRVKKEKANGAANGDTTAAASSSSAVASSAVASSDDAESPDESEDIVLESEEGEEEAGEGEEEEGEVEGEEEA